MVYKYVLLKDSFGIVIFLDIDEVEDPEIAESDVLVSSNIYLRIGENIHLQKHILVEWIGKGIRDMAGGIHMKVNNRRVCLYLKKIDFDDAHFQDEGLYCAVQAWISKYYDLPASSVRIELDKNRQKFIFHITD